MLSKILAAVVLVLMAYVAIGGAMVALRRPLAVRGEMVDIGGRRLHLICEGPKGAAPTVLFEAGAFGFSADGAVVQDRLAALRFRTCTYDRAGLGLSDPGPEPRDGLAVVGDLERLLATAHEPGPYILVGHSMAGLYLRLFANRNRDRTAGLVLVDATTPEAAQTPIGQRWIGAYIRASRLAAFGAAAGLYEPLSPLWFGDKIGLSPAASAEKRRAFASPFHNRWASAEVDQWFSAARQAAASGPLDPNLPVAVVMPARHAVADNPQLLPARQSRHGSIMVVEGASHATLLGQRYAEAVVQAAEQVRAAARGAGS